MDQENNLVNKRVGYGLIGCGGFGSFCLEQYRTMPELRCVAVTDVNPARSLATAAQFGLDACASPDALLARHDIDLVHIATPPFTHRALALAALGAGKHVLCEKPIAVGSEDACAMVALSRERQRLLAVNLIMRYNPLCVVVKTVVERGYLGEPLHAQFINDAQDELLPLDHWFWDREKSGGIFIEHGVHFFDVFEWWFGPGRVLCAQQVARPERGIVEQVHCTVLYQNSTLASFYHGFHQATRMEHQEWKLGFEMGTVTMRDWVPTSMRIDCLADEVTARALCALLPAGQLHAVERYRGAARHCIGRHKPREVDGRFSISTGPHPAKMDVYGKMLRALLGDQLAAIRNPAHQRRLSETSGIASLATAVAAQGMVDQKLSLP
jgi:predicted dehydrogenase